MSVRRGVSPKTTRDSLLAMIVFAALLLAGPVARAAAPVLDITGNGPGQPFNAVFTEGNEPVPIVDAEKLTLTADSANLFSATVTITNLLDGTFESIQAVEHGNILADYDPLDGVMYLYGMDSPANYALVLRSLTYGNGSPGPNDSEARQITIVVNDGFSESAPEVALVQIISINDPPFLDLNGPAFGINFATSYNEGNPPVPVVSPALTVSDPDHPNLVSATITLLNPLDGAAERLDAQVSGGVSKTPYDPATGVLVLTGPASLAAFQTVLRTVTYVNTSANPNDETRTISFVVSDGWVDSPVATTTLAIIPFPDPPIVDLNGPAAGLGFSAQFVVGGLGVAIVDPGLTVTDPDSSTLVSAIVRIWNQFDGLLETLDAQVAEPLTKAYNPATGVLVISGPGTVAEYQAALRTVTYHNAATVPITTPREITFTVRDESSNGLPAMATVSFNFPPLAQDDVYQVRQNGTLDISAADGVLANDSDDGVPGELNVITPLPLSGPANGVLVLRADGSFIYAPHLGFSGTDSFTYQATDGALLTRVATVTLDVYVPQAPVFVSGPVTSPSAVSVGQAVSGMAVATVPVGSVALSWDFGDGTSGTGDTVSHVYSHSGTYLVTVTALSSDGVSSTASTSVAVSFSVVGANPGQGIVIGGGGLGPKSGTGGMRLKFTSAGQTTVHGSLRGILFPPDLRQEDLANLPGTLTLGQGPHAQSFYFVLGKNGRGKATSLPLIQVNLKKASFAFMVKDRAGLTSMSTALGATYVPGLKAGERAFVALPVSLAVGNKVWLAMTYQFEYQQVGSGGKAVLRP